VAKDVSMMKRIQLGPTDDAARLSVGRRRFLQAGALTLGGVALAPLVNARGGVAGAVASSGASPAATDQDPNELFRQGWFQKADQGYRRLLRGDPDNAHALARRGYIALLSNKFEAAETFLTGAVELAPDDTFSRRQLANTFVRQDKLAQAVPLLSGLGGTEYETERAWAVTYASIDGTPYEMHGADSTTVPFPALDPLPHFELSVNAMAPHRFMFDTGAGPLTLTKETAQAAGLVGLATSYTFAAGQQLTVTHGVADSIRIGEVELRNVPVTWPEVNSKPVNEASARLGAYVQQLRLERSLSVRGLAARAKVDFSWLSRLERGRIGSPDARSLWRIARAMDVEVADIYLEAGYGDAHGLPGFGPYLRAKYHLPPEAVSQLEAHFALISEKYHDRQDEEAADA
jgi:transcriptional regulator with XRE-family HTH domain